MINFNAFDNARRIYKKIEMPFLSEFRENVARTRPYRGLKILHNIPLTVEAVLKIETLLQGGADVTASCITLLPPRQDAVDILKAANVEIQIEHNFKSDYDFHLDCCGELILIPPKKGAVELTQTGGELYKKSPLTYPVISVDDSPLKLLETLFGTGDGFIRALALSTYQGFHDKKFMIFGYGKVGRGIVQSLIKFTDKIVVIDVNHLAMKSAMARGIKYIDSHSREKIKEELKGTDFVVTATGIKNLLSDFYHFTKQDFNQAILSNMGADDEYGHNFSIDDVLFEKKPLNFSTSQPTTMKYLDPVLYAHNISIDLILSQKIQPGYHAFPEKMARDILNHWAKLHHEEFFEIEEYFV
jgi:adenosylhomocysteinase